MRHFILQLETLYFDFDTWLELDASFRRSVSSRTLIDIEHVDVETACHSEALVVHARLDRVVLHYSELYDRNATERLDDYVSFIRKSASLSLKSLYLDSSFQISSNKPQSIQSSIDNLIRLCRERKIDLVFEQVPVYYESDPCISAEFIRRQSAYRRHNAGGEGAINR
ncbi:hypothetical protein JCM5350_002288 [Sporobolomyces pararoseus]